MPRATAIIQAAVAALSGDTPPDNTLENGYTEVYLENARADSLAEGEAAGRAVASTYGRLTGAIVNSSSALGTITRTQGQYSCDVVGAAPANPEGSSWVTIEATLADGATIQRIFAGFFALNSQPTGDVMPFIGWCTGADLATASDAILYTIDGSDGDGRVGAQVKDDGVWGSHSRATVSHAGGVGVGATIGFANGFGGSPVPVTTAMPITASGAFGATTNECKAPSGTIFPIGALAGATTLHIVIGFTVRATVGAAVPTTSVPLVALHCPPNAATLTTAPALFAWLGGQSLMAGNGTGQPVDALEGTYHRNGTYETDWSPTDDHGPEAGMLIDHGGTILRGVYARAAGGTSIADHRDTIGPAAIAGMQALGIVPATHFFWQGSSESQDATDAAGHQAILSDYLDLCHATFPDMDIYLLEVQTSKAGYEHYDTVNAGIRAEAAARSYVSVLVSHGDVTLGPDLLHPASAETIRVGGIMGTQMITDGHWDEA